MRVWRVCRRPFSKTPLDGRGGLVASGRWHTARRLVVYASESLALASLEVLVHCDVDLLPNDLVAIEIDLPKKLRIAELDAGTLPRSWRVHPAPRASQQLGNDWLDAGKEAVLRVPSAVVPTESNFLLNPLHPGTRDIRVVRRIAFRFDQRLTT